jgi:hypothetical protein
MPTCCAPVLLHPQAVDDSDDEGEGAESDDEPRAAPPGGAPPTASATGQPAGGKPGLGQERQGGPKEVRAGGGKDERSRLPGSRLLSKRPTAHPFQH